MPLIPLIFDTQDPCCGFFQTPFRFCHKMSVSGSITKDDGVSITGKAFSDSLGRGEAIKSVLGKIVELDSLRAPTTKARSPPRLVSMTAPSTSTPVKNMKESHADAPVDTPPSSGKGGVARGAAIGITPPQLRKAAWLPKADFSPRLNFNEMGVPHASGPQLSQETSCQLTEERSPRALARQEQVSRTEREARAEARRRLRVTARRSTSRRTSPWPSTPRGRSTRSRSG